MTNTIRSIAGVLLSIALLATTLVFDTPSTPAVATVAPQHTRAVQACLYQWGPETTPTHRCTVR